MTDHTHDDLEDRVRKLEVLEERIQRLEKALRDSETPGRGETFERGSIHPELEDEGIAP